MAGDGHELNQNTIALSSGGKTSRLLKSGEIIGESYRLKGLIGRGGMGYVFRAEHIIIGKDYALKMLAPDQINEVTWNRFQSEGKAIARLDHQNIVKIYNMGVDRGEYPFYVMDLLDGVALSDCIKDKMAFSVEEVLDIFIQLASGFGYAHSQGIIHRDVKPSNVVLINTGGRYPTAKIVDFGIAKLTGASDLHGQSLTATGDVFGSPYYMSPEQCLGTEIDHRSDIYSLGCTLFETLSGHPPFRGESPVQTVMMHQNKPSPSLESVSGKFSSDEMEEVVAKMLMKRPAERYQSMEQVRHDLVRISERKGVGKSAPIGFKTSMDAQLAELGAGYEEEQTNRRRRKKTLIIFASLIVIFASAVCVAVVTMVIKPTLKTKNAEFYTTLPSVPEQVAAPTMPDSRLEAAVQKLAAVTAITSTVDTAKGIRTIHCPEVNIGTFFYQHGVEDFENLNLHGGKDDHAAARGDARIPLGQRILLCIDGGRNHDVLVMPNILTKFAANEISGLALFCEAPLGDLGNETEEKLLHDRVVALIKDTSKWSNCTFFEFYHVPAPDAALIELDKDHTVTAFVARNASINSACLAKRKFLRSLRFLELFGEPDLSEALSALKGSTALRSLEIGETVLSPASLKCLADCPNLKELRISYCQIDGPILQALSTIKSLKRLSMVECKLKQSLITDLAKLQNVDDLNLDLAGWPPQKREQLFQLLPRADHRIHRGLTGLPHG